MPTNRMPVAELKSSLAQFSGTEQYHVLHPSFLLTDGARFLADHAGAYWLMELIYSYQYRLKKDYPFQVWTLTVTNQSAVIVCTDGNDNELVSQNIPFTDFPLSEITLWLEVGWLDEKCPYQVVLLPNEH